MYDSIKKILEKQQKTTKVFQRNVIKDYLQILGISFVYSRPRYQNLYFYGGSCLRHCYELPRLSEDLDFVDTEGKIKLKKMAEDLKEFFEEELGVAPEVKVQKFRIYLKFPILYELGVTERGESNLLFLKVEVFSDFGFCRDCKTEVIPIFKHGQSVLVKTFDLSTLMATKIRAVLSRKWEKTTKNGKVLAKVKGRDYFDLMWYLQKDVKPNLNCVEGISKKSELKKKLKDAVKNIDAKSVRYDLLGLIKNQNFVQNLSQNLKEILLKEIEAKL